EEVVEERDDGADRELELVADADVDQDAEDREHDRPHGAARELAAHLGPDRGLAAQLGGDAGLRRLDRLLERRKGLRPPLLPEPDEELPVLLPRGPDLGALETRPARALSRLF